MDDAKPAAPPFSIRMRRYLFRLAFRLSLLLLLYVLSIGPMFWQWYAATYMGGSPYVRALYGPLLRACGEYEIVGVWVNRYINWWVLG